MNREPIFSAAKKLGAAFRNAADVATMDKAIDEALATVEPVIPPAPVVAPVVVVAPPVAGPVGMISASLLAVVASPRSAAELEAWVEPLKAACVKIEANTIRRVAAFLAQIAHESDFKPRAENLNYSVEGLMKTFGRHRISAADCHRLGRAPGRPANQQEIANTIYGGKYGRDNLGNTQPGDGWLFRGTGPLQVTGRGNFERFAAWMGLTLEQALIYARTLEGGVMAAAWFWEANSINRLADTPGVADESKKINGGTNGLTDRANKFNALVDRMLKIERGEA